MTCKTTPPHVDLFFPSLFNAPLSLCVKDVQRDSCSHGVYPSALPLPFDGQQSPDRYRYMHGECGTRARASFLRPPFARPCNPCPCPARLDTSTQWPSDSSRRDVRHSVSHGPGQHWMDAPGEACHRRALSTRTLSLPQRAPSRASRKKQPMWAKSVSSMRVRCHALSSRLSKQPLLGRLCRRHALQEQC